MKDYLIDMLDNTYNSLVSELFTQLSQREGTAFGGISEELFDRYHFFKLCTFMIQVQRLKASDE